MIMVMTVDGVIAKTDKQDTFGWNSKEDRKHFRETSIEIGAVIEGSNTYQAVDQKALKERQNFVVTRNPDKFKPNENVEFVSGTAEEILEYVADQGIEHVALIGGAAINGMFLKAGLVDELLLTVEPKMFGEGLNLTSGVDIETENDIKVSHKNE